RPALGVGRGIRGGRQPDAAGARGGQPGLAAQGGAVAAAAGPEQGEHPQQAPAGGPGGRLPPPSPPSPALIVCLNPGFWWPGPTTGPRSCPASTTGAPSWEAGPRP